ncbi:MCE family protein [Mycobacteroides abscessus]|uniref:MCE family protein n=1 Tax=Mycobacteroides abscessus TaxID=36809 RepID=UPI001F368D6F|nr:MCE family protein [Mycobacteroides abscessus]
MTAAVAVSATVFTTLRRDTQGATNAFTALFTDALGLREGDDVRVAGVRVGRVDSVQLDGTVAKVAFRVQADQELYTDTVASVTYQNVIGQRYLGLAKHNGSAREILPGGSEIPLERTNPSFDVSGLLNGYEPLFTLLDPQKVDDLTAAIVQALQGDSGALLSLLTETSRLAESFAGPDQVLGEVISRLDNVMSNLANQNAALQDAISQSRDIVAGLADRRDELIESVGSAGKTLSRLSAIANGISPDVHALLSRDPGTLAHLVSSDGRARLAYLGSNTPALLKGLARVTQEGSYINAYACDVNVTIFAFLGRLIPSVVEHATPGGRIQQSSICR